MPAGPTDRPTRARPVADAPVTALIAGADELAKGWLLELVASGPLAAASGLPLDDLVRDGPALCAAMARALSDDAELARLAPDGDLTPLAARAAELAGAHDPRAAVAAIDALRRVLWDAALAQAPRAPGALVADLADRLAAVCSTVVAAALAPPADAPDVAERAPGEPPVAAPSPGDAPPAAGRPRDPAPDPLPTSPPSAGESGSRPPDSPAAGVERLAELARAASDDRVRVADLRTLIRPPFGEDEEEGDDQSPPRVADGDPRTHLAARAAEFVEDGRPFAVLLVELDGVEALLAAERDEEVERAVTAAEHALEDLVRPGDALRREAPGRLWLTLPGAGPAGARALALRAVAAVERAADHRGRALTATVGVAVCPRDGADAEALAEHAEDDLLAAQAAGTHGRPPPSL